MNKIKRDIRRDIRETETDWHNNPTNDYYFSEITALRRALNYVLRAESQEYTALDKWANKIQGRV